MHGIEVVDVHLTADNLDQVAVWFKLNLIDRHLVDLVDNACVMWGEHLCAVIPVCLIAIIFAWVVAGSDVDTCLCAELTDGERNLRSWAKALKEIGLDAIGTEDVGNSLCKKTGVVAAVMAYDNRYVFLACECLVDIVSKSLSGHTHNILVHSVSTCTHDAT